MNKKLIKTISSIVCGLGILTSIPFVTSCNSQKKQGLTVMYDNSLTGNFYQLSFEAGNTADDKAVGRYTHLFSVKDNQQNPIKIKNLKWIFFDASTGKKINWLSMENDSSDEYSGRLVCNASDLPVTMDKKTRRQIRIEVQNSSYYGRLNNPLSFSFTQPEPASILVTTDLTKVEIDPFSQGQYDGALINAAVSPWQANQSVNWTIRSDAAPAPGWLHIKPFDNAYELSWDVARTADGTQTAKISGEYNYKITATTTATSGNIVSNEVNFSLKVKNGTIIPETYLNVDDTDCYGVREDLTDVQINNLKQDGYTEIEVPDFVTDLQYGAFSSANNPSFLTQKWNFVKKLSFETNSKLTTIGQFALCGHQNGDSQPFNDYDFSNCQKLTTINNSFHDNVIFKLYLPASIKKIDDGAFARTKINEIWFTDIPTFYSYWTTQAFANLIDDEAKHYIYFMNGHPEGYEEFITYLHEKCGLSDKWQAATD